MDESAELFSDTPQTKAVLRKRLKAQLKELPDEARNDTRIVDKISKLPQWRRTKQVFAFIPLPAEPDIIPLIDMALGQGKQVLVPICEENGRMRFAPLTTAWKSELVRGKHHILCPKDNTSDQPPLEESNPIILVPGLAFTTNGNRLGRGGGYYDRYLETWGARLYKIGVCLQIQLLPALPTEPNDQKVDIVVTD